MTNEKQFILFGAGKIGKQYLECLGNESVFAFADNNLAGGTVCCKPVLSIDKLKNIAQDVTITS